MSSIGAPAKGSSRGARLRCFRPGTRTQIGKIRFRCASDAIIACPQQGRAVLLYSRKRNDIELRFS
jgi:hypothetical protein